MIPKPLRTPPKWWSPKLNPFWVRFWRPLRRIWQRRDQLVAEIEVRGLEHLQQAVGDDRGVLITPNHPGSADPYVMYDVSDELGRPFYFMAAWQLFGDSGWLVRHALRHHGVFSVDREGTDLRAFKQAVKILASKQNPLVIFPEGEVYHINDRVTPFREGAAAIALSAVRRGGRPVSIVPAAMKYHYLEDPTPTLRQIMDELEKEIFWRPQRNLSLADRIYRFAEGPLALKELEYQGRTSAGPLPERVEALREFILSRLEDRHGSSKDGATTPERIKTLRRRIIQQLDELAEDDRASQPYFDDLDDVFFCVQLLTYPGDYVQQSPTIERVAETIDKFAEDVLGKRRASVCAARRVTVSLDRPMAVIDAEDRKAAATSLTRRLEERVQCLLDEMPPSPRSFAEPTHISGDTSCTEEQR